MAEELSEKAHAALEAMKAGFYVLPLQATGKTPKISGGHGYKDATRDETKHSEWWGKWPHANIGIRVGHGPIKIVVFDVDNKGGKHGNEILTAIETKLGIELPKDVTISTPNLGFQYYLLYPPEWEDELLYDDLGEALGLGAGVEIKAKGYVLLPPSQLKGDAIKVKHPTNKGCYAFENGATLANFTKLLPTLPNEFITACIKPAPGTKEWDEVRRHRLQNDDGETLSEKYDITMAKVFTPPRDAIQTSDGYRIKHPVHGATNPHNVTINMNESVWYCHRHNHGGDALEFYAVCQGVIACGERLRGDDVNETRKRLRDAGIISEVLAEVPQEQKITIDEMAEYLTRHPKALYAAYRATIDDYHQADWKLKTIQWRGSFRISLSSVVSLIHLDTSGPSRSGKTSVTIKFLEFIPDANKEILFSTSAQALWHMTV
ncbi:MAG: bifunctional DNA primase/polymerase, partial [Halobacteriota archaeon]